MNDQWKNIGYVQLSPVNSGQMNLEDYNNPGTCVMLLKMIIVLDSVKNIMVHIFG